MSKASRKLSDKILSALPMKQNFKFGPRTKKSLEFVKNELGMNHLATTELTSAQNYKYYDDFVISQLPIWAKKELTPVEVMDLLDLKQLSGIELKSKPNFKYYDEFMNTQVLVWGKEDLSVSDVLIRLGLDTLRGAARTEAVNYKYYDEFLVNNSDYG
ncbi:unnamed protein product [Phytophthora lilii]|uniref:Unnamed protein product n=1 Tax=Phytophthora lilii TaxID=2077276 RepID=A0A9W6WF34_9STRA|nr:unnamed protein product [Phytophthora lilii]